MSHRWTTLVRAMTQWNPYTSVDESAEEFREKQIALNVLKKWKNYNSLDDGSIYSMRQENIAGRDMPMLKRPPTAQELRFLATEMTNKFERRYINRARVASPSSRTFKKHVIQKYNAPPRDRGLGYRMPRPPKEKKDEHELALEAIKKKPTVIRTATMGMLNQPVRCQNPCLARHAYCEVLGPASCSACIESTNKSLAEELQRRLYPGIDTSTNSLVAPRVAALLCRSEGSESLARQIPYNRDGIIDYRALRKKSTVTDRFRRIKIAAPDLIRPAATDTSPARKRVRKSNQSFVSLLKTML